MKIKIHESGDEVKEKRKFCLLPTLAVDKKRNLGTYIVWLEWVTWNGVYHAWTI